MAELTMNPEEERLLIRDIALAVEANCKEGDSFYLITQRWWQNWIDYVNQDTGDASNFLDHSDSIGSLKRPTKIDNSDLISYGSAEGAVGELLDTLLEGRDYVLLPQEIWDQLYSWYGGGPTLARKAICSGPSQTELTVEVYPLRLQVLVMPKNDRAAIRISKKETVGELHQRVCKTFDLNLEQVCIWDYYGLQIHALMTDMDKTLEDVNIQMDQDILVEVHNNTNGTSNMGVPFHKKSDHILDYGSMPLEANSFLLEPSKSNLSIAGGLPASKDGPKSCNSDLSPAQNLMLPSGEMDSREAISAVSTRGATVGLTGLQNLGNTCFMNSAIQCLVHTPEFANYFREDYHQEINWQNPLGMVGELALAFGELLRKLWAPGRTPVAPRPFKAKLARFAPQFSGYNQHDSQELLAFLLDGLHEDLNRVKDKPYVKSRDADGRPDEEVADEYWANHIARNDSIIVDVCQGQYKSTLVCPVCNKVSVTFDPFMYLSLPLQSTIMRSMTVTVFSCDGSSLPFACNVTVPKQGRCRDLIHVLGGACSLKKDEEIKLAEIRNHSLQRFFEDPLVYLSTIKDDDHLVAYKVPKSETNTIVLKLIIRRQELGKSDNQSTSRWKPFGTPILLPVSCDGMIRTSDVQTAAELVLSPFKRAQPSKQDDISHQCAQLNSGDLQNCTLSNTVTDNASPKESASFMFTLQLVDDTGKCSDVCLGDEKAIEFPLTSVTMPLFLDWSQKLSEIYDLNYLDYLPEVLKYGTVQKKARHEPLSLYTCLEAFLREEPLVPEDMWYCPQCEERRQASKKLDLWRLPEVLVIHLKRFSYSRSMKHKLETFVNFPVCDFDLTNYIANKNNTQQQLYELYALINHYGGMGSGHYTAHIKLVDENRWYNFDDSHISPVNEEEVKSSAAYVLFYRRLKTDDDICNGVHTCSSVPI